MYEIDIDGLDKLMLEARKAVKYAWEHYDELVSRKHFYTLFGALSQPLGACTPSSLVPLSARKLQKSTQKKNYMIYELDDAFNVLRTMDILNYSKLDYTCHHFEWNGMIYACPFKGNEKKKYNDRIYAIKHEGGKPVCFIDSCESYLFAQFYEYSSMNRMAVTSYSYWPKAEYTQFGYLTNRNAPIGARNSPVQCSCQEEIIQYIEFSHWFK